MDDLSNAETALEAAAGFDPNACSGDQAIALLEKVGRIRRLADGVFAKLGKRVDDTAAYTYGNDRSAAELCARVTGVSSSEAKRAIAAAGKLESLPETDAAVRAGTLSARAADLIAQTAADDPAVESQLIEAATKGYVPLRDKCIAVRAAREDQAERAARQDAEQSWRQWPTPDGMVEGHYKVTPQVGAELAALMEPKIRKKFRDARKNGKHEPQDKYAAEAFAEVLLGDAE